MLTEEEFKEALPPQLRKTVNPALIDQINHTLSDPEIMEAYKENLLSYTSVLTTGKFKMTSYLDAVRYVSFKLMNMTNLKAYSKTFPDKIKRFAAQGVSDKDISAYVAAYNKSKLVNLIYEQTLIPTHILNANLFQEALNTQAYLMKNAHSEKVRRDAADSILNHLKRPETHKIELDLGLKETDAMRDLKTAIQELAAQQKRAIESGVVRVEEVAAAKIIEGEYSHE